MARRGESSAYTLTNRQVMTVLGACLGRTDRLIIGLQLLCGLRADEVIHLNSLWITNNGNIRIPLRQQCNCEKCLARGGMWKPRTKAKARTIPIPKSLQRDLAELLRLQPYGLAISRITVYNRTKAVLKRAKVKYGFPDCLAATYGRILREAGMSAEAVGYMTGKESVAVNRQIKDKAVEQAQSLFR